MTSIERVRRVLERTVIFAAVWFVVAEGDLSSWGFGVGFVAAAVVASVTLTPVRAWRIRPLGALRYAWFFVHQSVAGGFDVALRAIRPSLPIDPELVRYDLRIAPEHARVLLADTLSLLPGTLSSGIEDDTLTIHVLDKELDIEGSTRQVEERIADLFGLALDEHGGSMHVCEISPEGEYR